jgi:hypothetical protein
MPAQIRWQQVLSQVRARRIERLNRMHEHLDISSSIIGKMLNLRLPFSLFLRHLWSLFDGQRNDIMKTALNGHRSRRIVVPRLCPESILEHPMVPDDMRLGSRYTE